LRQFRNARKSVQRAMTSTEEFEDIHSQLNSVTLLARLFLAQGQPERAVSVTEREWPRLPSPTMHGDFLATRGLALAAAGEVALATQELNAAVKTSRQAETVVGSACAQGVVALRENAADAQSAVHQALESCRTTGDYDAIVTAYRAEPRLLSSLAALQPLPRRLHAHLATVDRTLASRAGLARQHAQVELKQPLSRRELEVLQLIRQGLSNKQIARTLWISEATVKVHVRHILEKLGVRSRTEAALTDL